MYSKRFKLTAIAGEHWNICSLIRFGTKLVASDNGKIG